MIPTRNRGLLTRMRDRSNRGHTAANGSYVTRPHARNTLQARPPASHHHISWSHVPDPFPSWAELTWADRGQVALVVVLLVAILLLATAVEPAP